MQNDAFVDYAINEARKVGSIVEEYSIIDYQGIKNARVINSLVLSKGRFYARLPLLVISKQAYDNSAFFRYVTPRHFPYDQTEETEGNRIFYKYVTMQGHTTIMAWARNMMPSYNDATIMAKLQEECPAFCKVVKFSYENFKYRLISYPDVTWEQWRLNEFAEGVTIFKQQMTTKPINYEWFIEADLTDALFMCRRTEFLYNHMKFAIDQSIVFWVQQASKSMSNIPLLGSALSKLQSTKEHLFPQGLKFNALILYGGRDSKQPVYMKCKTKSLKQQLSWLFSNKLTRVRELYQQTPDDDVSYLFLKKTKYVSDLRPGDIICQNDEKMHFAVFIGNGRILHSNMEIRISNASQGQHYLIETVEDIFKGHVEKVNVVMLKYCPFTIDEIMDEAVRLSKEPIAKNYMNKDHENMPFIMMAGSRFSYQNKLYEMEIDATSLELMVQKVETAE